MSIRKADESLVTGLFREMGDGKVSTDRVDRLFYSRDQRPRSLLSLRKGEGVTEAPVAVVWPESAGDVAALMKWAETEGVGLTPYGGGTGYGRRTAANRGDIVVDMKRMAAVEWIRSEDNLVRAQAGILDIHLEEKLNLRGLTLGNKPSWMGGSTLGGWLAEGSTGHGESKYGSVQDLAVSLQIVLPSGMTVETNPSPGSSTGPCWTRFFAGSSGDMGIITAAVLKTRRLPQKEIWRGYSFQSMETGCRAVMRLMRQGLKPSFVRLYEERDALLFKMSVGLAGETGFLDGLDLRGTAQGAGRFARLRGVRNLRSWIDRKVLKLAAVRPKVFNKISESLLGRFSGGGCILVVAVEGNAEICEAEFGRCNRDIQGTGGKDLGESPALFWKKNLRLFPFCLSGVFTEGSFMETIQTVASWDRIPDIYRAVRDAASGRALVASHIGNPSPQGGGVDFTFVGRPGDPDTCLRDYDALMKDVHGVVVRRGGYVKRSFFGQGVQLVGDDFGGGNRSLLESVKRALDPHMVMNPGSHLSSTGSGPAAEVSGASLKLGKDEILRSLGDMVGSTNVSRGFADMIAYGHDGWARRLYEFADNGRERCLSDRIQFPVWIVRPGASAEVANVVRFAARCDLQVVSYGGGTSLAGGAGGPFDRPTVVIDTKRMCQILDVDEASSMVHVQAGILGHELETRLARRNLFFGHLPSSFSFSTVGGWLSVRGAGEMIAKFGRADDMCLGLSAVLPSGDLVHGGSGMMNPHGREVVHLLTGAEGRLGVITTAHLRLAAPFETTGRLAAVFKTSAGALNAWAQCFAMDVEPVFSRVLGTGETMSSAGVDGYLLLAGFAGPEPVVTAEKSVMSAIVESEGGIMLDPEVAERMRYSRHRKYYEMIDARVGRGAVVDEIDVSAPWSRLSSVGESMKDSLQKMGARVELEWSDFAIEGGCIKCRFFFQPGDDGDFKRAGRPVGGLELYDDGWRTALDACRRWGGCEICYRGLGRAVLLHRPTQGAECKERISFAQNCKTSILDEPRWELFRMIEREVDPNGIFGNLPEPVEKSGSSRGSCSGSPSAKGEGGLGEERNLERGRKL